MNVAVIVLNWNRPDDTLACVQSLRTQSHAACEILVVDNGSTDGSVARFRAEIPDIGLLPNPRNLGFAEGNNAGIRRALAGGADAVLLLNNDTVADPLLVQTLAEAAAADPRAGFLGARIFYHEAPTRIWMGKPVWDAARCRFEHVGLNEDEAAGAPAAPSAAAYACGCAVLVPRRTIEDVGLMDPRFFCYYEEIDWCFRGAARGWESLYVPAARVWHKVPLTPGGRQSPLVRYYRTRNSLLWAERHLTGAQRWRVFTNMAAGTFEHLGWQEAGLRAQAQRVYWNLLTVQRDPLMRAWRRGVRDYLGRRFGEAPTAVTRLAAARPQA